MTRREAQQHRYFRHVQQNSARVLHLATTLAYSEMVSDLVRSFREVCEYRKYDVTYQCSLLLSVILIGLLSGENDIKSIEAFVKNNPDKVNEYLKAAGEETLPGNPSDSTLLRSLHNVNYLDLLAVVAEWSYKYASTPYLRHIAIDGKALRACLKKCFGGTHPPYILNAFDVKNGVVHSQIEINSKTNEIGNFYDLLKLMKLDGAFITGDAAFSTARAMKAVVDAGGHMACPIKDNQQLLEQSIGTFIDEMSVNTEDCVIRYEDSENGQSSHGRIYWRTYELISEGVDELLAGTDFEGIGHSVARVHRVRQDILYDDKHHIICNPEEKTSQTVMYILDTANVTVEQFARFVRDHWAGCEIIHYVLDTEFDEDQSRIITGYGMQNMALLRKACITILKSIKNRVKRMSFHTIRITLRDLGGIPADEVSTDSSSLDQPDTDMTG